MNTAVFDCPDCRLRVFRAEDGSWACDGTYNGAAIRTALPIDGECVILLDPDASKASVFRNLLRIGRDGRPRWLAELPTSPDVFLAVHREDDGLAAHTWSGFRIRIDPSSGSSLEQEFVK